MPHLKPRLTCLDGFSGWTTAVNSTWTLARADWHNVGEPSGGYRTTPLGKRLIRTTAEGIHKDTDGPGQASECG